MLLATQHKKGEKADSFGNDVNGNASKMSQTANKVKLSQVRRADRLGKQAGRQTRRYTCSFFQFLASQRPIVMVMGLGLTKTYVVERTLQRGKGNLILRGNREESKERSREMHS